LCPMRSLISQEVGARGAGTTPKRVDTANTEKFRFRQTQWC
jgi:hypothetical protein